MPPYGVSGREHSFLTLPDFGIARKACIVDGLAKLSGVGVRVKGPYGLEVKSEGGPNGLLPGSLEQSIVFGQISLPIGKVEPEKSLQLSHLESVIVYEPQYQDLLDVNSLRSM